MYLIMDEIETKILSLEENEPSGKAYCLFAQT